MAAKMAAKMAAENSIQSYLCSAIWYECKQSVQKYELWDVEVKYSKVNNTSCITSKIATKMAAKNLNLMYLNSAFRYKYKCPSRQSEERKVRLCR